MNVGQERSVERWTVEIIFKWLSLWLLLCTCFSVLTACSKARTRSAPDYNHNPAGKIEKHDKLPSKASSVYLYYMYCSSMIFNDYVAWSRPKGQSPAIVRWGMSLRVPFSFNSVW